ncbi:hypothetical protein TEQG_02923 [Trichophyton equinum CBS 127.97]|uniref:Uncharacterized protein n=1 Tax=Trichophyton equinum (strain ATCC MYA-4606 / CBS 127.97) TaxID=559882 RepID=F2PPS2_TRIEC|nr:hypothetical protein TEQG_02923 [Trichophyton equinum CBS 127.97]
MTPGHGPPPSERQAFLEDAKKARSGKSDSQQEKRDTEPAEILPDPPPSVPAFGARVDEGKDERRKTKDEEGRQEARSLASLFSSQGKTGRPIQPSPSESPTPLV